MHKWAKKDAHYPVTVKGAYFSATCPNDSGGAGEKTLKDLGGYAAVEVHCEFGGVSEVGVEHGCFEADGAAGEGNLVREGNHLSIPNVPIIRKDS